MTKSRKAGLTATTALIALSSATLGVAQDQADHGIAGFWMVSFGPMPPLRDASPTEADMLAELGDDAVLLADSGLVEFDLGQYGGLDIHDVLVEEARDYDPLAVRSVSTTCRAPGLIYSMQGPFPIEIFEGRDLIVIRMEYFDLVRIVFMNETEHPDDWPVSMTGHSIGRWDGDTLIIDTVALEVGTLFNNGIDHTNQIHLEERFRLADDNTLVMTQQFEDPGSFSGTAARILTFNRGRDHVYPYDCDPAYDLFIESRQGPGN
jgi:hypothetical protein